MGIQIEISCPFFRGFTFKLTDIFTIASFMKLLLTTFIIMHAHTTQLCCFHWF